MDISPILVPPGLNTTGLNYKNKLCIVFRNLFLILRCSFTGSQLKNTSFCHVIILDSNELEEYHVHRNLSEVCVQMLNCEDFKVILVVIVIMYEGCFFIDRYLILVCFFYFLLSLISVKTKREEGFHMDLDDYLMGILNLTSELVI